MSRVIRLNIFLAALLLIVTSSFAITPEEAADHIGETVTVSGVVEEVFISKPGNVFLNFGGKYPNHKFVAVFFAKTSDISLFEDPKQYEGKNVSVTGKVKLYKGKPEIIVKKSTQIQ